MNQGYQLVKVQPIDTAMTKRGLLCMHASANEGKEKKDVTVFFGLSGTGKTTLSADPKRTLIGDDETGWSPDGIFNFEGGCYAKCIKLSQEAEPMIWDATNRFGAVLENVVFDPVTRIPDYDSDKLTENTRSAYPLDYIPNASRSGMASHPKNIIFLAADAYGVMPPIAKLTPAQAMYHFLSGYTAKVAGTEKGLVGVEPEFSTCFGAPFLPRPPAEYGNLLRDYIAKHNVDVWLVNSGWTGGIYGVGHRMPIKVTRALVTGALDGSLKNAQFRTDKYFGFAVPTAVPGIDTKILNPDQTWADKKAFDETARKLVGLFQKNFKSVMSWCAFNKSDSVFAGLERASGEIELAGERGLRALGRMIWTAPTRRERWAMARGAAAHYFDRAEVRWHGATTSRDRIIAVRSYFIGTVFRCLGAVSACRSTN